MDLNKSIMIKKNDGTTSYKIDHSFSLYEYLYDEMGINAMNNNCEIEEEKNNMKSKAIVDLYFRNMREAVEEKTAKTVRALTAADSIISAVQQKIDDIRQIIKDNSQIIALKDASFDVEIGDLMSKETESLIEKAYAKRQAEINRLVTLKNEVLTMLIPCETYAEEMEVLFAYGVIDDDGKLVPPDADDGEVA